MLPLSCRSSLASISDSVLVHFSGDWISMVVVGLVVAFVAGGYDLNWYWNVMWISSRMAV